MTDFEQWKGFEQGKWCDDIDTRDFIQMNYTPYDGDESFLAGPTDATNKLWGKLQELQKQERAKGGVLDMDTKVVQTITSHGAGYLDKDKETIVGFQTDKPFKRGLQVNGGIRMAMKACSDNGYEVDPEVVDFYTNYRKTHNAGVFDAYTPEIRTCRTNHIVTVFQMLTDVDVSSATTEELHYTVLIHLSQIRKLRKQLHLQK